MTKLSFSQMVSFLFAHTLQRGNVRGAPKFPKVSAHPSSFYYILFLKSEKIIYIIRGKGIEYAIGKVKFIFARISLCCITNKTKTSKVFFSTPWHASSTIEVAHNEKLSLAIPRTRFVNYVKCLLRNAHASARILMQPTAVQSPRMKCRWGFSNHKRVACPVHRTKGSRQ